jgi:Rod binding domain-containing protein
MNLAAAHNLKPFGQVHPNATGVDLAARPLQPSVRGDVGRYATEPKSQHEQLVEQTRTWVSQTFFGTLLKQMRDSPFKSELFSGGRGGEAFAGLQDQHLAEHMARGAGSKLVNGIVRRIEANAAYRKQGAGKAEKADNHTDARRNGKQSNHRRQHGSPALRA